MEEVEQLLKDALYALNCLRNERIFHERYEKSYDVAKAITTYFRKQKELKEFIENQSFKAEDI